MVVKINKFTVLRKECLCEAGLERLKSTHNAIMRSLAGDLFKGITESDVEDPCPNEMLVNIDKHVDIEVNTSCRFRKKTNNC